MTPETPTHSAPVPAGSEPYEKLHKDGSIWATGFMLDGVQEGYWEWFRLDGSIMRSGSFVHGEQAGEWTTYDSFGRPYKTTNFPNPGSI